MGNDKWLHDYSVRFVARVLNEDRLRTVLERNFSARAIEITHDISKRRLDPVRPPQSWKPRPGSLAAHIIDLLDDGRAYRASELIAVIGGRRCPQTLARLVNIGAIDRVKHGIYVKAGVKPRRLPPRTLMGPGLRRIYELLKTPRTAVELRESLQVTRQAIEQSVKRMMERGLIKRVSAIGERGSHLYVRADQQTSAAISARAPNLRLPTAQILSTLPMEAPARLVDVVGRGNASLMPKRHIRHLVALGLVELAGPKKRVIVKLTNRGREHPQYDQDSAKVAPLSQSIDLDRPTLDLLLIIHALGTARSIDITMLTGIGRGSKGKGKGTGQHVQQLQLRNLIERVQQPGSKGHSAYRLTKSALGWIATLRGQIQFPDPDEVRRRLEAAHTQYRRDQSERSRRYATPPSFRPDAGRMPAIIALLRANGPLDKHRINALLPKPYAHPRSVDLALDTLRRRGDVIVLRAADLSKRAPRLWALPDRSQPGENASELPTRTEVSLSAEGRDPSETVASRN